jgi:hypothetical protein
MNEESGLTWLSVDSSDISVIWLCLKCYESNLNLESNDEFADLLHRIAEIKNKESLPLWGTEIILSFKECTTISGALIHVLSELESARTHGYVLNKYIEKIKIPTLVDRIPIMQTVHRRVGIAMQFAEYDRRFRIIDKKIGGVFRHLDS